MNKPYTPNSHNIDNCDDFEIQNIAQSSLIHRDNQENNFGAQIDTIADELKDLRNQIDTITREQIKSKLNESILKIENIKDNKFEASYKSCE